jgi:hypothetical protein
MKEQKDFVLVAWGRSGGSSEAESNAGTRRRRVDWQADDGAALS